MIMSRAPAWKRLNNGERNSMAPKMESAGKEALLDAARVLFLERGYVAVSMQQIAEAAGMTKGAPYYHFTNKEELFVIVFLREVERQEAGFIETLNQPGTIEQRLTSAMAYVFETTQADLFSLYTDAGRYLSSRILAENQNLKREGGLLDAILIPFFTKMDQDERRLRIAPIQASHFFTLLMMGQLHTLHDKHGTDAPSQSPREMASALVDLLLNGI